MSSRGFAERLKVGRSASPSVGVWAPSQVGDNILNPSMPWDAVMRHASSDEALSFWARLKQRGAQDGRFRNRSGNWRTENTSLPRGASDFIYKIPQSGSYIWWIGSSNRI
eukprot:2084198-Amphidinium_carterae.2